MADLFDRLFPATAETENIPVHYFFAAMIDYMAGETTRAQIIGAWDMDADAQADLNTLCDHIDGLNKIEDKLRFAEELHAVMMLTEGELKYTTKSAFATRLGLGS